MELFKNLQLIESQKQAHREVLYAIRAANDAYKEWKKRGNRRKNATNIVTTSVNKIATISPESLKYVNSEMRQKIAIIIMRCMTLPVWKPLDSKKSVYRKLYPYIKKLELVNPNTGTEATLRQIIMTRLSAAVSYQSDFSQVFVAYEPIIPDEYLEFIFGGKELPKKTYKMEALGLPEDYDDLIGQLEINHGKAVKLYKKKNSKTNKYLL